MLDVTHCAIRPQRTEATRVVRTSGRPQRARRGNVEVGAIVALRTETISRELLTFSLVAKVESMRKFTRIAFFAQAALVVLADEMTDTLALFLRRVVSIGAARALSTSIGEEILAYRPGDLGWLAQRGESVGEVVVEGERRARGGVGVQNLGGQRGRGGCGHVGWAAGLGRRGGRW